MELDNNLDEIIDRHRKDSFWTGVLVGAVGALGIFVAVVLIR